MQPLDNTSSFVDLDAINVVGVAKGALTTSGASSGTYIVYLIDSPFVRIRV